MAALDGNSILGKIIDLLLGGKVITTTTFLLSELASRPADAFIFRLEFGRFLQTNQDMVGFPLDHRKQLQEQHRISIEPDARSLSASTRQLLGIDEDGQVPEGQVPNAQALLTAYGAASAQAANNYKHLLAEAQAAWAALSTYLGLENTQEPEMLVALDFPHMRQRGPNVNAVILVVKNTTDEICKRSSNLQSFLSAFTAYEWPATPQVIALTSVKWSTHVDQF